AAFQQAGIAAPEAMPTADGLPRDGSWLRKPIRSAGGAKISVWHGPNSSGDAGDLDFFYQQHKPGKSHSAVYLAARGKAELLGLTRQLTGPAWSQRAFGYAGSLGPIQLRERLLKVVGDVLGVDGDLVDLDNPSVKIPGSDSLDTVELFM